MRGGKIHQHYSQETRALNVMRQRNSEFNSCGHAFTTGYNPSARHDEVWHDIFWHPTSSRPVPFAQDPSGKPYFFDHLSHNLHRMLVSSKNEQRNRVAFERSSTTNTATKTAWVPTKIHLQVLSCCAGGSSKGG
ncbi:unnamed protein product [Ectocarpus fasciculatus]